MDEYTRYTLEEYYTDECSLGVIMYASYNYEDMKNSEIVSWLNIYGSSIYVVERWNDGDTDIHNLTYKLWGLSANKDGYVSYFSKYLGELL